MPDPVSEIVTLLQPQTPFSKKLEGVGRWGVRCDGVERPHYAVVLKGTCQLVVDGGPPTVIEAGDFALIPSADSFVLSGLGATEATMDESETPITSLRCRRGDPGGEPDVHLVTGYCGFASPDAGALLTLLPRLVHVRGEPRLGLLVRMVDEEVEVERPARDVVLGRLLELLFIEGLRFSASLEEAPSLLRGLADERLSRALRSMHERPWQKWTVPELARVAALSRSSFFERFRKVVGQPPMDYLAAWRMSLARRDLRSRTASLSQIAHSLGYKTANSFSIAFTRRFGVPPSRYAGTSA